MKIKSLQISNIISFAHVDDIANAPKVTFDKNLNIVIGQNGAGKSTALEIINFVFRRVLFITYSRNRDLYTQRTTIDTNQKKQILAKINDRFAEGLCRPRYFFASFSVFCNNISTSSSPFCQKVLSLISTPIFAKIFFGESDMPEARNVLILGMKAWSCLTDAWSDFEISKPPAYE